MGKRVSRRREAKVLKKMISRVKVNRMIPLFLGILIFGAYYPILSGEFILDDKPLIQKNPYVVQPHSIVSYLSQVDGKSEPPGEVTGYYRPLIQLTYRLDYWLWGMSGAGFRGSNLFYHFLASLLLFAFIKRLTGSVRVSFWAAALFALHPANTEAVSWVSSRNNILVACFGLASLCLYVHARETGKRRHDFFSLLLFAGALLCKEFGVVLLPVFFLWAFLRGREKPGFSGLVRDHLPFVIVLCAYFFLRFSVTGFHTVSAAGEPFWRRILFAPYLIAANTQMILFPSNLHSFMIRFPSSVVSWQTFAGFLFVILLVILLWKGKERVFRFAIFSYLFSLAPILHLIPIPSPTLISMRWLYFPMIFLLVGVSPCLKRTLEARRRLTSGLLCLLVGCFGFLTHVLNETLWHDEERFFSREVQHFRNEYYSGGLAEILHQKGDYQGAEEQFRTAVRTGNRSAKDLINYGALLIDRGRAGEALPVLQSALGLKMSFEERGELHNNLGLAEFHVGRSSEALLHFRKAVAYGPQVALFWSNLGGAYGSGGDYRRAAEAFDQALKIEPDSCAIRKGVAITLMNMQDYAGALSALEGPGGRCDLEFTALLRECRERTGKPSN
jgi:protein O-mannosyl-transferase